MITIPSRKHWHELSGAQQAGIVVMTIVQLSLLAAALLDLRRRPAEEINGTKGMWTAAAFINIIGPISYFVWGRKR